jgi:exoribonuclease R
LTAQSSRSPISAFVELERIIQGLLHVSNSGDDYFTFYPAAMSLVGERSGRRIK